MGALAKEPATLHVLPGSVEPFLTKQELAETYLKCSVSWVEKAMKRGMPSHKLFGARRFLASEVRDWLKEQQNDR